MKNSNNCRTPLVLPKPTRRGQHHRSPPCKTGLSQNCRAALCGQSPRGVPQQSGSMLKMEMDPQNKKASRLVFLHTKLKYRQASKSHTPKCAMPPPPGVHFGFCKTNLNRDTRSGFLFEDISRFEYTLGSTNGGVSNSPRNHWLPCRSLSPTKSLPAIPKIK